MVGCLRGYHLGDLAVTSCRRALVNLACWVRMDISLPSPHVLGQHVVQLGWRSAFERASPGLIAGPKALTMSICMANISMWV